MGLAESVQEWQCGIQFPKVLMEKAYYTTGDLHREDQDKNQSLNLTVQHTLIFLLW